MYRCRWVWTYEWEVLEDVEEMSVDFWGWVNEVFPGGEVVEDGEGGAHCCCWYCWCCFCGLCQWQVK